MPPANSPDLTSALRQLESPIHQDVLNLAATLGTSHGDDLDSGSDSDDIQLGRERMHRAHDNGQLRLLQRQRDDLGQRDRLRRVMSRLSRLSDSASPAYGDRVPSQNNSLYDWAPAAEHAPNHDDDDDQLDSERERIRSISTRLSQERAGESLRSTAILQNVRRHPRISARSTRDYLQRYSSDRDAARTTHHSDSQPRSSSESARQMAMRRPNDTVSSLDRERRDMLSRADSYRRSYLDHRSSTSTPPISPMLEQTVKYLSRIRYSNVIDDSLNCALDAGFLTKGYFCLQDNDFLLDTFSIPPPVETSWLAPGAVLSGCQHATSVAATVSIAPGTDQQYHMLHGSNRATLPSLAPPTRPWLANSYNTPRSRTSQPDASPSHPPQQDRWPVKVTIHEVDWHNMSLSATMEAYNVPSHPHSHQSILNATSDSPHQQYTRTSSITTYLEGEILDFNHHTLLTESFKSNASNDATYWRKLPPFRNLSDEEVVRALTDKKWYNNVLNKEYVLMRWKERCFVKSLPRTSSGISTNDAVQPHNTTSSRPREQHNPYRLTRSPTSHQLRVEISSPTLDQNSDHAMFDTSPESSCGLTISGFYYVCLRRRDGGLDGLYYDPQSSPYQCLRLESKTGGARGAWEFR